MRSLPALALPLLLVGLLVAAGVAVYVAYPQQGREVPVVPQLGEAMLKGREVLPVLDAFERSGVEPAEARSTADTPAAAGPSVWMPHHEDAQSA